MEVASFDFQLPEALIAQTPLLERTESRMLTLNKHTGGIQHKKFTDLTDYLQAGDTLVLNDTRVLPARLFGVKEDTGAKVELLLLKPLSEDRWEVLARPGKRLRRGSIIHFGTTDSSPLLRARIEDEGDMGNRIVQFTYDGIFNEILNMLGQMPLPPYIKQQLIDQERYQTVYAKSDGSAAAPTAGLHFSLEFIERLRQRGINIAYITLHVGLGTFRPVSVEQIEEHEMHAEYYEVSAETALLVNQTKEQGGKVVAVGTTSARTLETVAQLFDKGSLEAAKGWTNIFIFPGYSFRIVDALLTNFHLPKSTLLMLVSALAGKNNILQAYQEAIDRQYRFFSFGDAMFIY